MDTQDNNLKCRECGNTLILVEVTTRTIDKNPSPITKSTFRCSNNACQAEADKRDKKRVELKKEQEEARELRRKNSAEIALKSPRRI